ncbi:MAG: AraC family transcriptional regulator [Clostridiaceae bacterium]|nr:AraC family transcriptional regulator [Clostridiaceae bacterium]
MPIYFTSDSMNMPIYVHSIGNDWYQSAVKRDAGFPYYHWLQTENGEGVIRVGGIEHILKQGQGIMLAPFIPHEYEPVEQEWKTSFVSFYGCLQNELGMIFGQMPYVLAENCERFSPQDWVDRIIREIEGGRFIPEELSIECYRFLLGISSAQPGRKTNVRYQYQRYIEPVLIEISKNYNGDLTVQQLADLVYVTPQYLTRIFQEQLGSSVHNYLTNYRIRMAKELLINKPEISVRNAGIRSGMPTTSHFIAVFKERVGYTPLEFRNLHY